MKKNPAEIAGTRYKDEKLMSRVQKTDGTSRCFAQMKTLNDSPYLILSISNVLPYLIFCHNVSRGQDGSNKMYRHRIYLL